MIMMIATSLSNDKAENDDDKIQKMRMMIYNGHLQSHI